MASNKVSSHVAVYRYYRSAILILQLKLFKLQWLLYLKSLLTHVVHDDSHTQQRLMLQVPLTGSFS